jgi:hypothetical protein
VADLTDVEKAEQIERIQRIQRIKNIQALQAKAATNVDDYGMGGAFAEKALDMATAGHGAEITAGLQSALPAKVRGILNAPLTTAIGSIFSDEQRKKLAEYAGPDSYVQRRDLLEQQLKEYEKQNPKASMAGNVAGIVAGGAGLARAGLAVPQTLKQAVIQAPKVGAAMGLIQDPGSDIGEIQPVKPIEAAKQAAIGAVTGTLLAPVAYGGGKVIGAVGNKIKEAAAERAFKSLGRLRPSELQGITKEEIQKVGGKALSGGIIKNVPRGNEKIQERIYSNLKKAGNQLDEAVSEVAESAKALEKEGFSVGVDKKTIADELSARLIDTSEAGSPEVNRAAAKEIEYFLESGGGRPKMDIKTTQDTVARLGKKINWPKLKREGVQSLTPAEQVALEKWDLLRQGVTDVAEGVANYTGRPEMASKIAASKNDYNIYSTMKKAVNRELGLERARNMFGVTSRVAAMTSSDPITGIIKAIGVKALDDYAPQIAAKQLYNLSSGVGNAAQALTSQAAPAMVSGDVYEELKKRYGNR